MAAPAEVGLVTWSISAKCPHCGHRAALHSSPEATACAPGTCHNDDDAFKYEECTNPCPCPGWHPLIVDGPEQLALEVAA